MKLAQYILLSFYSFFKLRLCVILGPCVLLLQIKLEDVGGELEVEVGQLVETRSPMKKKEFGRCVDAIGADGVSRYVIACLLLRAYYWDHSND